LVRLWSAHEARLRKGIVGAGQPHNALGLLGVMRRYASGGVPSIPRTWGRLTPGAPCPLPYRKRVAVSEALAPSASATGGWCRQR